MLSAWLNDSIHSIRGRTITFLHKNPPKHYLDFTLDNKPAVILVYGLLGSWGFLKKIGDKLSLNGHPVYIVKELGHNLDSIPNNAKIIEKIINKNKLKSVIIVGHSKGGLIGKYLLLNYNKKNYIKGVIAIASPFNGAVLAGKIPLNSYKELTPESEIIKYLSENIKVNKKIVSIFPSWDNYVGKNSSNLVGAKNVEINARGHNAILFAKETIEKVVSAVEKDI